MFATVVAGNGRASHWPLPLIGAEVDPPAGPAHLRLEIDPEPTRNLRIQPGSVASYAIFLLRVVPDGGRSDIAPMLDGLPTPRDAKPLASVARAVRFRAWAPIDVEVMRYWMAPMVLDDGRFELQQQVTSDH